MINRLHPLPSLALYSLLLLVMVGITALSVKPLAAQSSQPNQQPDQTDAPLAPMSAELQQELETATSPVSFLVVLADQPDTNALLAAAQVNASRSETQSRRRAELVYQELTNHALRSQAALRTWLDARSIAYEPFYLVNMIEVQGDASLASTLQQRRDVGRLIANPKVVGVQEVAAFANRWLAQVEGLASDNISLATAEIPYGLTFTHADQLWANGVTGQGIVVGSADTGVEWDLPAIKANYRGYITATNTVSHTFNWFDAIGVDGRPGDCDQNNAAIPCDDQGHGSHTVGTMVGDARVVSDTILGMAPNAQWIGCRNMRRGVGTPARYIGCFEFFMAPYPQGGDKMSQGRPDLGAHLINNSWGCPPDEGCDVNTLKQVVETVRSAGIMVVASAGNRGALGCFSVRDPIAIYDASFTIGAHNNTGEIASFSSRGPVTIDSSGRPKPDISAPGVNVRSVEVTRDGGGVNNFLSGTSMAAPHVAGAIALLWSAVPSLTGEIDLTEQVLIKSAVPKAANQCATGGVLVPNPVFGFGHLDVAAAVNLAQQPASAALALRDCNGAPLAGVTTQLVDTYTGFVYSQTSDISGTVSFPTIFARNTTDVFSVTVATPSPIFSCTTLNVTTGAVISQTLQANVCSAPITVTVTVLDRGGAPVPNTRVKLDQAALCQAHQGVSNGSGLITFANVISGDYSLTAESACFTFGQRTIPILSNADGALTVQASASRCDYFFPIIAKN